MKPTGTDGTGPTGLVLRSRDLADLAGTTPRALRHYHQIGLLAEVPRDSNGYRRYGVRDLIRVLRIRQLAAGGMPLREIGGALDRDVGDQDQLLAQLDRDLAAQQQRISTQRRLLAELRDRTFDPRRFSAAESPTAVQEFDQDVWTLLTASSGLDPGTAAAIRTALHSDTAGKAPAGSEWYEEFERLGDGADPGETEIERLAQRIADFARALAEIIDAAPAGTSQTSKTARPYPPD